MQEFLLSEVIPMRRKCMGIVFLLCGIALLPACLRAQLPKQHKDAPGSLDGEVVDAKGVPVAGAQILWQAADGGKPHVLHSDAQGQFRIAPLRSGLYELRASAGKIRSEWSHNVVVRPGAKTKVKLRLEPIAPSPGPPSN
jgi:protocatechuate 3,4-dioxygenase beta subunit